MERNGFNTAHARLKRDAKKWQTAYEKMTATLRRQLKISKAYEEENCKDGWFNINSGEQLANALEHSGVIDPDDWIYTDKGNRSTSVDNLTAAGARPAFLKNYSIYSTLSTYINTFLSSWIETGARSNGFIHPTFNQVRTFDDFREVGKGTKTGRPSSSNPNFNNLPANVEDAKNAEVLKLVAAYLKHYGINFTGLRDYIVPDKGGVFIGRDYAQQELRVLAHYEDGELLQLYLNNPNLDIHQLVADILYERTGWDLSRKATKTIAFAVLYGLGLWSLAEKLDCEYDEAKRIKRAYMQTLPGVKDLDGELKDLAKAGDPMRTWGGRVYYCEEPTYIKGQFRDFAYKMLNLLIQGSSADITKQAMIQVDDALTDGHIKLQVYDELLVCTGSPDRDMPLMREAMEDIKLDCPLPTDGEISRVSWGRMRKYKDAK